MARTQRLLSAPSIVLALAALASCSSGGRAGGADADAGDDPRGVTERVRRLVQRFSYGEAGPYAAPADGGNVFGGGAPGGAFEGADSPGLVGPPAATSGAYDRADPCASYCAVVAGCFDVDVPGGCVGSCSLQIREVARIFGDGCAGPLLDLYACVAGALVCSSGGDGGESADVSADVPGRCGSSLEGLRACVNRSDVGFDVLIDGDDEDDGDNLAPRRA